MDGVRRGHESEESEVALEMARQWRGSYDAERLSPAFEDSMEEVAIYGESQVEWAVRYVYDRIDASISHMSTSLDALGGIVALTSEIEGESTEHLQTLVLLDGEEERRVVLSQVMAAKAQLPQLRQSLEVWLTNAQSDVDE